MLLIGLTVSAVSAVSARFSTPDGTAPLPGPLSIRPFQPKPNEKRRWPQLFGGAGEVPRTNNGGALSNQTKMSSRHRSGGGLNDPAELIHHTAQLKRENAAATTLQW